MKQKIQPVASEVYALVEKVNDLEWTIKVLTEIREHYERKFGIRMYANGEFNNLKHIEEQEA